MPEETSKNNFFKDFLKSIKDLDKYEDFAIEMPKKAFKYFIKLLLIFAIIISFFYTYQIVDNMNKIYANLKEKLPDFSYEQGNLKMSTDKPVIIEDYQDMFGKILIDTSITGNEVKQYEEELDEIKNVGILVLKDKAILLANNGIGQVTYTYTDLLQNYNIDSFTKQDIVNYIDNMNIVSIYASIYFVIFVYLFIIYFISIFLDVLLLSVLAFIISRISKIKLKYAPSFGIAIHSITLPVVLNLIYIVVNLLTGFRIKYFQLMYSTISYIYVIVAVLMIKTDFINRQLELIKLAEEQEKVKAEMKRKEEEEKQKEQEQNKKPEEKPETKEKEKNKKEKKQKGDEGKGVGADAPACQEIPKQ